MNDEVLICPFLLYPIIFGVAITSVIALTNLSIKIRQKQMAPFGVE